MRRVRVILATESPDEADAIARYLRTVPWIEVVAEAADLRALHALQPIPPADLLLINDRLPGNTDPEETLRYLHRAHPGQPIVRITTMLRGWRSPIPLAATLAGEFSAETLLNTLRRAARLNPVIAVGAALPGSGVTSTVVALAYACLAHFSYGQVALRDLSDRPLLPHLFGKHPLLQHPRFTLEGDGVVTLLDLGERTRPPDDVTWLVAVKVTGLRALTAPAAHQRFGRAPDAELSPPQPSPLVTGVSPTRRQLRPYVDFVRARLPKGWDTVGTAP